jgi:hypothetical protein
MVNESGAGISPDEKNDSPCADASVFCSGIGTESNSTKTTKAHAGELMYFGGWNCLSLLFADADVAPYQLVKIGEFDREIVSLLKKSGSSVKVEIGIE